MKMNEEESEPRKEVMDLLEYKSEGKVLDLGCGSGRNSLFLAEKGFDVTAVDYSKEKIKELLKKASKSKLKIKALTSEISKFDFKEKYDIIIATYSLNFLVRETVLKVLKKMKEATKEGGINLITCFTVEDLMFPKKNMYFFKQGLLKKIYSGWEILKYDEKFTPIETHGRKKPPHRHHVAILIAKKKVSNSLKKQAFFNRYLW